MSGLKDNYEIQSNRESGHCRYDLLTIPKDTNKLGIVMEFKAIEYDDELKLKKYSEEALFQIKASKYITELKSRVIKKICLMGIYFYDKKIKVISEIT